MKNKSNAIEETRTCFGFSPRQQGRTYFATVALLKSLLENPKRIVRFHPRNKKVAIKEMLAIALKLYPKAKIEQKGDSILFDESILEFKERNKKKC